MSPEPSSLRGRRLVFVLATLELGGAERQAFLLARQLNQDYQASVRILALHGGVAVAALCARHGLPCTALDKRPFDGRSPRRALPPSLIVQLGIALRASRPDAVLGYTTYPNVACGLIRRLASLRLFVWGQRDTGSVRTRHLWERLAIKQAEYCVANSDDGRRFLLDALHVPFDRVRVIPNGVALDAPQADRTTWRRRLGIGADDLVVCMLGAISRHKDHVTLLRSWKLVLELCRPTDRPLRLVLAGRPEDGSLEAHMLVDALGVGQTVQFPGFVTDVSGLLGAADLAVFSSKAEGLPNAILEPMAAGLAVVATTSSGARLALGPAGAAWLVPVGDAAGLAERIAMLVRSPDLRREVGARNRSRVASEFDVDASAARFAQLLITGLAHDSSARER